MRARVVIGVLVLAVLTTGACSSKKKASSAASTSTSSTATAGGAATTTTVSPSSPTAAGVKATTAESASSQLFDAWKAGDKTKAKQVAGDAAVNELFSHPYTGPSPTFEGCEAGSGKTVCSYSYEGGGMFFTVEGSAAAGYRVTSVDYIAD
jgi:hypothetical protein